MEEIEITIKDLHDFLTLYPDERGKILIEGKDGWFEIDNSAITAPNSKFYTICTEDGKKAQCSPDHLFYNGDWIKCKNLKMGDLILTDSGYSKVSYLNLEEEKEDLYDIEVRSSHNYFGNGILSHNSSISQVITFCLYGKIEGKKLKDIPNRINGNTWTRVTLDHFGSEVVVERGLDPSFFRIFIDGAEYDQAGIKNVQDYLVDNILGIPYYVFNNTILLSINDFKSFIKMSPQDKRAIIDKIFGFHILNQMREVLKGEIKKLKESSDLLCGKINSLEMSLNSSMKEMEQLTSKIEEQSQTKIQELEKTLATFEELQKVHGERVNELKEKEEILKSQIYTSNQSIFDSKSKVREVIRKLGLYESDKCPTCEGSLQTEFHQSMREELQGEKEKLEKSITEAEIEYQKLVSLKDSMDLNKNEILEKGMKIRARIESLLKEINDLKKEDVDLQTQSLQRIIKTLESDKSTLTIEKYQKEEKQSWFKSLDEVLSERGVKQMAIRTILPSLNSEIVELLKKINLGYQVIFDEEFSANIYHMGMEISSQTLSTGEMKKIDFVVLISIMKLMKMKFSNINLLFLDELFSSVDQEGVYQITSILKDTSRELGLNIFVINHAPMPHEIFDYKLEITKANNFSSLSLDKF